jgi:two-component system sensor histidine kinase/response regulator
MAETILIADDEDFIVEMLAALFEDEGYRVLRAHDGLEALTLAEREHPDLVLSDVLMPRLSGIELVRRLRHDEDGTGPPVILLSAVPPPRSLPERTTFVAKPFDIVQLLGVVTALFLA